MGLNPRQIECMKAQNRPSYSLIKMTDFGQSEEKEVNDLSQRKFKKNKIK